MNNRENLKWKFKGNHNKKHKEKKILDTIKNLKLARKSSINLINYRKNLPLKNPKEKLQKKFILMILKILENNIKYKTKIIRFIFKKLKNNFNKRN